MSLKIPAPLPIFPAAAAPPSGRRAAATDVHFSRWNNANAQPFIRRRREQQEIEDDIRRHRRHHSAARIADDPEATVSPPSSPTFKSHGTPSSPSRPSIPGKKSKYSKPYKPPSHPAFHRISRANGSARLPPEAAGGTGLSVGDNGIGYRIKDAPFEFQYSYTETPKVKPLALREPPFLPFGPTTMPRPWTGRAPLPASKKKLPEFDSFKPPPAGKKGVKPVQSPGPFVMGSGPRYRAMSREEILGEPLTEEEVKELIKSCMKTNRQLHMGRDGFTHNMLDNIHAHWKRRRVCKIKCIGVCTVDMDNVCQQLEEKTGGKIIHSKGGVIYLFRGRNYNYRTRPKFPLMLWRPVSPVYPRLVQRVPEGLTWEEAVDMRKKGHQLPPICKVGKNGLYSYLVPLVREAFEECELVRINCSGLNKSDCRKIGAKLKDLVPCVLLSFAYEHILIWRGKDWKSSLPALEGNPNKATELVADGLATSSMKITDTLLTNGEILEADTVNCSSEFNPEVPVEKLSPDKDLVVEGIDTPMRLDGMDQTLALSSTNPKVFDCTLDSSTVVRPELLSVGIQGTLSHSGKSSDEESSHLVPFQHISHNKVPNSEVKNDLLHPEREFHLLPASSIVTKINNNGVASKSDDIFSIDGLELLPGDGSHEPSSVKCGSCMDEVMYLLQQAVENGMAIVFNDESLDTNIVYERSVALAKTAPPGPVFRHRIRKKKLIQKIGKDKVEKYEEQDAAAEVAIMSEKRGNERKISSGRKREGIRFLSDEVPRGSLGVDELAKLLT